MSTLFRTIICLICCTLCLVQTVDARSSKKSKRQAPVSEAKVSPDRQIEASTLYYEALTRRQTGRVDQAYELLLRSVEVDSTASPAYYALSQIEQARTRLPQALEWSQKAVKYDSLNYWYAVDEARIYRGLRNVPLCVASYERLMRLFPQKVEPCYDLASIYLTIDSLSDCVRVLNRIEELDGISRGVSTYKFNILLQKGETEAAFNELKRLVDRYPYNMQYRIFLGDMQMQNGLLADAKRTYDEASAIDPNDAYLWLAQANYYNAMGHTAESDSMVRAALVHPSLDIETKTDILLDYLKTSLRKERKQKADSAEVNLPMADSLFATVIDMHPTAPEFHSLYSEYLEAVHQDSLARQQMRYALDLRPSDSTYWNRYIYLQMQTDDAQAIHQTATLALQQIPASFLAYSARAYAYTLQDSTQRAIDTYYALLQKIPAKNVEQISITWGSIGGLYYELHNMAKTYECFDQALKYNDKNVEVLNNYAYFLSLDKSNLAKAERMCNTVIKLQPDNPTYLDTYAWVYFQQGSYMLAKFYQEKAISRTTNTDSATLYEHYGDILFKCGEVDQAVENWQKAADQSQEPSATLLEKIRKRTYIESVEK